MQDARRVFPGRGWRQNEGPPHRASRKVKVFKALGLRITAHPRHCGPGNWQGGRAEGGNHVALEEAVGALPAPHRRMTGLAKESG